MKISKLLNKKYLSIIFFVNFISFSTQAEDQPVDIWNIEKKAEEETSKNNNSNIVEDNSEEIIKSSIYDMQSQKLINSVEVDSTLYSSEIKIIGLYDPEDYGLNIDMWSNSNGDQLKYLFSSLNKINLSEDAKDLMNILMLTNAHYPKINITEKEFLNIKSDWLIKNDNRDLIEDYLIKNQILNLHPELSRFLADQYLSESNITKACEIFSKNTEIINDDYLSKFNLYCLINDGKKDEAQLIFDLKKELDRKSVV